MKQAIQLEIPFDYSQTNPAVVPVKNSQLGNYLFPAWEQKIPALGTKIVATYRKLQPSLVLVAYTTLAVCFCFFMVFLAAILQG
jgi:hypothetical protein